jgi:energy-coupling factor transporter ATP-binding protein EcfA2
MLSTQKRFALVGPSGAGKSTTAFVMQRLLQDAVICSVAAPLREVQDYIYARIGHISPANYGVQDGKMLQSIRSIMLASEPDFLNNDFKYRLSRIPERFSVINDDCRLAMHSTLVESGFFLIWIEGNKSRYRGDFTLACSTDSPHDKIISPEVCDYKISNVGGLSDLVCTVDTFLKKFG